jgi:hypothetical protein
MYVTLYAFTTHPQKSEAVRRLYREWRLLLQEWCPVSTELLADPQNPDEMMLAARFRDEEAAWAATESAGHCDWYARLVGLAETGPLVEHYEVVEPG